MSLEGHFIPGTKGKIFVCQFGNNNSDTAVLCLPSIAEELNLARAVLAKQCQAFASSGTDSFILDYFGTGDSEGEFEDATPSDWLADIITAGQWLIAQGYKNLVLLGVRVGALLVSANQKELHQALPISQQMFWKPVNNGKLFVSQLIRIKQANQMMSKNAEKINWRNEILAGNATEVAGYLLTKDFVEAMESLVIQPDNEWQSPVQWFELAADNLTPASKRFVQDNEMVNACVLSTPAFWQVPEVFDLPELTQLGCEILTQLS